MGPFARLFGLDAVDLLDAYEAEIPLAVLGEAHLSRHFVARAEAEPADLGLGYVDIAGLGAVPVGVLEEAVAVVRLGQYARGGGVAVVFRNNGVALLFGLLPRTAATVGR